MIDDHFTLWVESQTGINWLASKALPELGTALPQLVLSFLALGLPMIGWPSSNFGLRFAKKTCLGRAVYLYTVNSNSILRWGTLRVPHLKKVVNSSHFDLPAMLKGS